MAFFRGWEWREYTRGTEVVVDLSGCEFLAPWAVALIATYVLWLERVHKCDVRVKLRKGSRTAKYVETSGLYELFGGSSPSGASGDDEKRTAPLRLVETERDIPQCAQSITRLLQVGDQDLEGAIYYSFIELLRNVVQHSRSPVGGVAMAQFYPRTGLVEVVVADAGVGIRTTLTRGYPELRTDLGALKFSLLPHVSGTFGEGAYQSMKDNAGLGLFFVKEIATRGSGGFFLASGDSIVDLWGNLDGSPGKRYLSGTPGWHGTFAMMQLRKDRIADFEGLLERCRELAAEARKDPGRWFVDFVNELPEIGGEFAAVSIAAIEEDVAAASTVREELIIPSLKKSIPVVLDFHGIRFATQSFAHALLYKVVRDCPEARHLLTIARASRPSQEAIRAVAAYASTGHAE